MSQQRTVRMLFAAVHGSVHDAVDDSSTGTRVPKMWALFKAPRSKARTTTVRPDRQVCNVRHNDPMAKTSRFYCVAKCRLVVHRDISRQRSKLSLSGV